MSSEAAKQATPTAIKQVAARILRGDFDGGGIADLASAIDQRAREGGSRLAWKIVWGDLSVTQEQVTLGDARWVEATTRTPYDLLQPLALVSHEMAVLACGVARRDGISRDEAWDKLDDVAQDEVKAEHYEVPGVDPLSVGSTSAT